MRSHHLLILTLFLAAGASAQQPDALPTIESKTGGLEQRDGFFPLYWDEDAGKVWMEVSRLGEEFLYVVSLPTGLGSNDVGLDRNRLGPQRVVRFERIGRKLMLMEPNLRFRARSNNADEVAAARSAFAEGTVWGFTVAARTGDRFLVDATDFLVRDAYGIVATLRRTAQGTFKLDKARSAPWPDVIRSFPRNAEIEAQLTFTSDAPGSWVRSVAADPSAVTLRIRHSLIRLPDDGYTPRRFDPRSGYNSTSFMDYAAPIGEDMTVRFINRHRLEKAYPDSAVSPPVEPIVYYLDRGTPEPVRSALLEGGSWWNEAFEAAGFQGAFRMELLPEDADPLDARYNVMNWVHRSTRGWSYGYSVTDPRTGEIIKGHVSLGSLRVRQDYLLMEGLISPYLSGTLQEEDPMLRVALARLRQLSAHEIGHTLGLTHNFYSSVNDRASVMDYPAPLIRLTDEGHLRIDEAYDTGIGEWDAMTIRYGYEIPPDSVDEQAALDAILDETYAKGLRFITDADARQPRAAHPMANLWDNGSNPLDALKLAIRLRERGLENFGTFTVRAGRPLATLHEALVPLYLHHRFQAQAAAKMLGGVTYTYAVRGDARELPHPIEASLQREALATLLATLSPGFLSLPPRLRMSIPPRPPGFGATRELFRGYTDPVFDPYAPAEAAAALVIDELLAPERLARMMVQADIDASLPGMSDVLADVTTRLLGSPVEQDSYRSEVQRITQQVWVDGLIAVADRRDVAPGVSARTTHHLRDVRDWLGENMGRDYETQAHRSALFDQIDRFLLRLYDPAKARAVADPPPGQPIGSGEEARMNERLRWLDAWEDRACRMP